MGIIHSAHPYSPAPLFPSCYDGHFPFLEGARSLVATAEYKELLINLEELLSSEKAAEARELFSTLPTDLQYFCFYAIWVFFSKPTHDSRFGEEVFSQDPSVLLLKDDTGVSIISHIRMGLVPSLFEVREWDSYPEDSIETQFRSFPITETRGSFAESVIIPKPLFDRGFRSCGRTGIYHPTDELYLPDFFLHEVLNGKSRLSREELIFKLQQARSSIRLPKLFRIKTDIEEFPILHASSISIDGSFRRKFNSLSYIEQLHFALEVVKLAERSSLLFDEALFSYTAESGFFLTSISPVMIAENPIEALEWLAAKTARDFPLIHAVAKHSLNAHHLVEECARLEWRDLPDSFLASLSNRSTLDLSLSVRRHISSLYSSAYMPILSELSSATQERRIQLGKRLLLLPKIDDFAPRTSGYSVADPLFFPPPAGSLSIAIISMECAHIGSKIGGLGEAIYGMAKGFRQRSHNVTVILPEESEALVPSYTEQESIVGIKIPIPPTRASLYSCSDKEQKRLSLHFCSKAIEVIRSGRFDAVICNDWQTAPAITKLSDLYPTLFVLHNPIYQGIFSPDDRDILETYRFPQTMRNAVKEAFLAASHTVCVSPNFAKELQSSTFPIPLFFQARQLSRLGKLSGILNGTTSHSWNPKTDPLLLNFRGKNLSFGPDDALELQEKKGAIRIALTEALREEMPEFFSTFHCENLLDRPIFLFIGRYDSYQKGIPHFPKIIEAVKAVGGYFVSMGYLEDPTSSRILDEVEQICEKDGCGCIIRDKEGFSSKDFQKRYGALFRAISTHLIPSSIEPGGYIPFESFAFANPVIASPVGGLVDSIRSEALGRLVDFSDESSLAHALHASIDTFYDTDAISARFSAIENHLWDSSNLGISSIEQYERVLGKITREFFSHPHSEMRP